MARTVEVIILGKDKLSGALGSATGGLQKFGKAATVVGAVGAAALVGVAAGAAKLAYDAAKLEPTRVTFDNLTASIGTTAEAMLKELRPATMGIVSDAELMKAANKLMAMGLAESTEEAGKLSKMATTLGMAMGEDATASMENFALMMANQSIPRLDSFGISSSKVRVRMKELQEATFDMTREEAFKIAVMEQGEAAMERVGDITETGAVKMAQFQTTITNLKDTIGKALLPVLHALMDNLLTPLAKQLEVIIPKVEMLMGAFGLLAKEVFGGDMERAVDFLKNEVWEVLENVFGKEIADKVVAFGEKILGWVDIFRSDVLPVIQDFAAGVIEAFRTHVIPVIQDLADRVMPILQAAIGFVIEHWETFAKIGLVVGAIILAITHPVAALIAAIGILAYAWTTNWGGIQDKAKAAWEFIKGILEKIGAAITWVRENILPPLGEAFKKVWNFIKDVIIAAWEGFKPHIEEMKEALREFWTEFKPRLEEAWDAIKEAMKRWADWIVGVMIPALQDLWDRLEPVREKIVELADRFGDFMGSAFVMGIKIFLEELVILWDLVWAAMQKVYEFLDKLFDRFMAWEPPFWFRWFLPGSMSPMEEGLRGIGEAFREMPPMIGGVGGMGMMTLMAGGAATIRVEGLGPGVTEELEERIAMKVFDLLIPGRA